MTPRDSLPFWLTQDCFLSCSSRLSYLKQTYLSPRSFCVIKVEGLPSLVSHRRKDGEHDLPCTGLGLWQVGSLTLPKSEACNFLLASIHLYRQRHEEPNGRYQGLVYNRYYF